MAGQRTLPVRRHETERVPALASPRMGGRVLFEHEMIDVCLLQKVANRQPGLPTTDDEHAVVATVGPRFILRGKCVRHDWILNEKFADETRQRGRAVRAAGIACFSQGR
jgi:hypothetical protein